MKSSIKPKTLRKYSRLTGDNILRVKFNVHCTDNTTHNKIAVSKKGYFWLDNLDNVLSFTTHEEDSFYKHWSI